MNARIRKLLASRDAMVGIGVAALVVLAVVLYFTRPGGPAGEQVPVPSVTPVRAPAKATPPSELTAAGGTYRCRDGKSFTLSVRADGTARVSGGNTNTSSVVLRKNPIGIWTSEDDRVQVREIADYTVLLENYLTTRDQCRR